MTILEIEGKRVEVADDFLKLPPDQQETTVQQIASQLKIGTNGGTATPVVPKDEGFDRNDVRFQDGSVKSAFRGVPVIGPLVTDRASAAISAAANPLTGVGSKKPSFGERYAENLGQEKAAAKTFEEEHPVVDAVSGGIGGALALGGFGGLVPAGARVLGMTGRLLPAMRNAALSGAPIGAADAAARGSDPTTGGIVGGIMGPAGVLVGKGVGKGFDAISRGASREVPVPQRHIDVVGEQVPVRESVITRDPNASMEEQNLLRGSGPSQQVAQQAEEGTAAAMERARGRVSASMDPTGTSPSAAPLAAGESASADLVSRESQRAAAEVARVQAAANETAGLRTAMDAPPTPARPNPQPAPHEPLEVGQMISDAVRNRFGTARAATRSAYDTAGQLPGEFDPGRLVGSGEAIRLRLNSAPGNERVRISPEVTPQASAALRTIDDEIAGLRVTNEAARGPRPITPADIEQVRKQLVIQRRLANNAARQTGNWEDARAVGRVIEEFTDHINDIARTTGRNGRPGFSGDGQEYVRLQGEARGAHAAERAAFSRRGPGDQVGSMMEGIIGKYPGQEMSPKKIIRSLLGSPDSPGGPEHAVAALGHLREVLGPQSQEWSAIKKAAISHFTEAGPGEGPVALEKQAERMLRFLGNERHSGAIFDHGERARLMAHANRIARVEDPLPGRGTVEQKIAVLSGRHTGEAATGEQVMSAIKRDPRLAEAVMREVSPESRALLKQGLFEEITASSGAKDWGPDKISERLTKFLNTELAQTVYTPNERMMMKALADAYQQIVPIPGTVNYSNTAHVGKKMVTGLKNQLLGLFGFAHGGLPGAGLALGLGKALEWGLERRAVGKATERFLGQQPRRAGTEAVQRAAVTAAQIPALSHQSR